MPNKGLTLGAFGLGEVGQGFLQLLDEAGGAAAHVKHVCVRQRDRDRITHGARLTYDALDILDDAQVGAIVELTNDPQLAIDVIRRALLSGRNAVTASKRVVAEHLAELIELQRSTGSALLYEASCGASIPVLHVLGGHLSAERITRVQGILNGTSNLVLTRMEDGESLGNAVAEAQRAGFAELDPSSDIDGDDARYKLVILLAHAFGTVVAPRDVFRHGIAALRPEDIAYGNSRGWKLRSLATAERRGDRVLAHVLPSFVPVGSAFAAVRNEYNAISITGAHSGEHLLQGKGAGRLPTGLAVLGDVQRLVQGGAYSYAKVGPDAPGLVRAGERINVYLRLPVTHQEVLARFDRVRHVGATHNAVQVEGSILLEELVSIVGDGRDDFQVIALPDLAAL